MRASILNESALVITSGRRLSVIWLCHIKLMPGRRALRAVTQRGPNILTYTPELEGPWPSLGFSRRPAGHTETPTGLVLPQGPGCSPLQEKGVRSRRWRRGSRRQTLRPSKAAGPSVHRPSPSPAVPAWLGGRGSGSLRSARAGDPTVQQCVRGRGARLRGEKGPLPHSRGAHTPHR